MSTDGIAAFELLREEMDSDETHLRVNAVHRLKIVATLMTSEQIRTTLLPYVDGLIKKEEDEVLFAIAEEIESLASQLPGHQTLLLSNLETLASSEETVVRDMAVKSLISISNTLGEYEIINFYAPLILRLANNDQNFTCRVSAVNMMCPFYPRAGQLKEKIRLKFIELCSEETPMVRRAVAVKIGELASVIEKEFVLTDLISSIKQLMSDEQDMVRVLGLNSLKLVAKVLKKDENKQHTLPIIIAATEDKSWRVRLALSKIFAEIAEAFGEEADNVSLIQIFTNLLRDAENDVRTASIKSLTRFIKILSTEKLVIIIPHLQYLAKDSVPQVRTGVTEVISIMVTLLPKEQSNSKLLPHIIELFDDENKEVRQGVTKSACKFVEVIGQESLKTLIPHFKKSIEDQKWRVRIEAYDAIAQLAKVFHSPDLFIGTLEPMFMSYMKDRIAVVRENGVERLAGLIQTYKDWALGKLFAKLTEQLNKDNGYLYRLTAIQSLRVLALNIAPDTATDKILPILVKHLNDSVPNIRFLTVKILKELASKIETPAFISEIKNSVSGLVNDADKDVKFFAQETLQALQR